MCAVMRSGPRYAPTSFPAFYNFHCSAIFPLLLWSVLVSSCSGYVNCIYPSQNDTRFVFNYIDTVYFTWTSNITDPYMNLWCAPSPTSPQSSTYVYHSEVSTNGTNPQSFPYSDYYNEGVCHMQVEDFSSDDWCNSKLFTITSDDAVPPQTWGLSALSKLGGTSNPTAIQTLSSTEVSMIASSAPFSTLPASAPSSLLSSVTLSSHSSLSTMVSSSTSPSVKPKTSTRKTRAATTKSTATTVSAAATTPATTPSPHSHTLTAPAKAGISVLSAVLALALLIIIVSYHKKLSKRITSHPKGQIQDRSTPAQSQTHIYNHPNIPEIGEGAYTEINGISRPAELCGTPRAELV